MITLEKRHAIQILCSSNNLYQPKLTADLLVQANFVLYHQVILL